MIFEHEINLQVSILFGRFCLIPNMKYQLRIGRNNLIFQVCDISKKKREGGNFILKVNTNCWRGGGLFWGQTLSCCSFLKTSLRAPPNQINRILKKKKKTRNRCIFWPSSSLKERLHSETRKKSPHATCGKYLIRLCGKENGGNSDIQKQVQIAIWRWLALTN